MFVTKALAAYWQSFREGFEGSHGKHTLAYRTDIDGLRALAVLAVVLFHAFPQTLKGGFIGVDIFFVISGYLITSIILNHLDDHNFKFKKFYAARVRRIFPSLILVLVASLVIGWFILLADEYAQLGKHVLGGAGFVANFILWHEVGYFDNASDTKPLLHLWSLGIEEQFYILWPLLLWLGYRFKWKMGYLVLLIGGGSLVFDLAVAHRNFTEDFYSPLSRFWELMSGAFLTWLDRNPEMTPRQILSFTLRRKNNISRWLFSAEFDQIRRNILSLVGILLILGAALFLNKKMVYPGWRALLPTVGTALLIFAGPDTLFNRRVLSQRPLVGLGLISYPLYLWHWPLLSFAHILYSDTPPILVRGTIIAASLLLAWATYTYIERPVRFSRRRKHLATYLCIVMGVVACLGLYVYQDHGLGYRPIVATNAFIAANQLQIRAVEDQFTLRACGSEDGVISEPLQKYCSIYGEDHAKHTIVLWTDSHGGQDLHAAYWSPVFFEIARDRGDIRVIRFSLPGCPPIIGVRRSDGLGNGSNCSNIDQGNEIVHTITKLKPDTTVLIARWSLYIDGMRDSHRVLQKDSHFITDDDNDATMETARAAMTKNLVPTIEVLARTSKVLVIKNFPVLHKPVNEALAIRLPWYHGPDIKNISPTLEEHLALSDLPFGLIDQAAHEPNVKEFDPTPFLCDPTCGYIRDGTVMYADDNHPSTLGALQFKDAISSLMYP